RPFELCGRRGLASRAVRSVPPTPPIHTPSLHDALPIFTAEAKSYAAQVPTIDAALDGVTAAEVALITSAHTQGQATELPELAEQDRKSTRLNSSHVKISYAVFCLKKKKQRRTRVFLQRR